MKRLHARAALVATILIGIVVASRRLGENYPIGPISMFSGGLRVASRIGARTEDGRICELSAFEAWQCPEPIDFRSAANPQCTSGAEHLENDRKAEMAVRSRTSGEPGGAPVEVVRRSFMATKPGGVILVDDCVLRSCTARERAGECTSTR